MPYTVNEADARYDHTQPWSSMFLPSSDVFRQDPRQVALMSQAIQTANPDMPEEVIRQSMTVGPPADVGPARPQPTIGSVLDGSALQPGHLYDRSPTDFSGTPAGVEASPRNSISVA